MSGMSRFAAIEEMQLPGLIESDVICRIGNPEYLFDIVEQTARNITYANTEQNLHIKTRVHQKGSALILSSTIINRADKISDPINVLEPLHIKIKYASENWIHIFSNGGAMDEHYPPDAFTTREWSMSKEKLTIESDHDGRSSNQHLPFLISATGDDIKEGLFCGMEWSGTWYINFDRLDDDHCSLSAGVKVHGIQLQPGETLRLPDVHLGFFKGGAQEGTNALRRYLYDHCCAKYHGEKMIPFVSYDHWFGMGNDITIDNLKIQALRAAEIGIEIFVVDAGWFIGGFPSGVGNYSVDPVKFPNGLEELASYIESLGMGLGLWFEPERICEGTEIATEHPDWLMKHSGTDDLQGSYLLNLSRIDVQDYLIELIGGFIERLHLKWSRWDFNIRPLPFWREFDSALKIQFDYMDGLYRILDELMISHPDWMIECCASGGRRIDIGTLKRAHTVWFSDQTANPLACRYMQARANRFLPGHLLNSSVAVEWNGGDSGFGDSAILSRMLGKLAFDGDIASWSPEMTRKAADWVRIFKEIRPLLCRDFFQLTQTPASITDWDAVQFMSYSRIEGVLAVFAGSVGCTKAISLEGVLEKSKYHIKRYQTDETGVSYDSEMLMGGIKISLGPYEAGLWEIRLIQ